MKFREMIKTPSESNGTNEIDEFIGSCLMSVGYIHSLHFSVSGDGSYSKHKALEEFYIAMQDMIDEFVEVYIGITGSYNPTLVVRKEIDEVEYLRELANKATKIYDGVDSSLQSILDNIKVLCYKTVYKLTKLS